MSELMLLPAALFLPLFPFSMLFTLLLQRVRHAPVRAVLLLAWPQAGLVWLDVVDITPPASVAGWAVATAALYALRSLVLRDVATWTAFLATSAWALLWPIGGSDETVPLELHALGFSLPLVLLTLLGRQIEARFGAAYAGLDSGLANSVPRLAGVFVLVVLAVVATPVFPAFFSLLQALVITALLQPLAALGLLLVWLLWTWSAIRLVQGMVVGPAAPAHRVDLGIAATWGYGGALAALALGGVYLASRGLA